MIPRELYSKDFPWRKSQTIASPCLQSPCKSTGVIPRKAEEKCITEEQYKLQYCHEMALISTLIHIDFYR